MIPQLLAHDRPLESNPLGTSALVLMMGAGTALAAGFRPPTELAIHVLVLGISLGFIRRIGNANGPHPLQAIALGCIILLAAKDVLPAFPVSGDVERRAALGVSSLAWPANARNPALGPAAGHVAALVMALALASILAERLAGSVRRNLTALQLLAWVLAAFGFAVIFGTNAAHAYGPDNCIGNMANKNGAGALVAIGLLLQAGLARAAFRQGAMLTTAIHLLVAAGLLAPLVRLGSWTALLALGAGTATYLGLIRRPGRSVWREAVLAIAVAAATGLMIASLDQRLGNRILSLARDGRWLIWQDSLALAHAYPVFGVGLGAFESVYPLHGSLALAPNDRLAHPDSSWVKLLVEWGALPMMLVVTAGCWAGWRHLRGLRQPTRTGPLEPGIIATAAGAALLASGLTDVTLHRPESLLLGAILLGISAAHRPEAPRLGFPPVSAFTVAVVLLALGGIIAVWAGRPSRQELRWSLLDPVRLWRAAVQGGLDRKPDPVQLARLQAAVRLQHRAVSYPQAAARALHLHSPAAAFSFWQLTVERAGPRGAEYFESAMKEFPATPPAYWAQVAATTNPDLTLLIPALSPEELARAIHGWLARERPQPVAPQAAYTLLTAVERARRADLLLPALGSLQVEDTRFWAKTARLLQDQGLDEPAWSAVARTLPQMVERPSEPIVPTGLSPETLLRLGRYDELRDALLRMTGTELGTREALLEKICADPTAPAWFHFASARELAGRGQFAAATERALVGLSTGAR